jgi:hypothetical protein
VLLRVTCRQRTCHKAQTRVLALVSPAPQASSDDDGWVHLAGVGPYRHRYLVRTERVDHVENRTINDMIIYGRLDQADVARRCDLRR